MINASDCPGLAAMFRREANDPAIAHLREANLRAAETWEVAAEEAEQSARFLVKTN